MFNLNRDYFSNFNFAGLPEEFCCFDNAKAVVVPVPYDLTTSYIPGTRKGPQAIIEASTHLELFDDELERDISETGIHTLNLIEPTTSSPENMVDIVKTVVAEVIANDKMPVVLGGEHSITLGAVQAFKQKGFNFGVIQFDAHADLRNSYQDSIYNHACIGRRIHEICPLSQIGIRSLCAEESEYLKTSDIKTFFARDIIGYNGFIDNIISSIPDNIYLTIDLDCFDPSIMPSVGTPEPGGLGWYQTVELLKKIISKKNIIGFDVVELCPIPGMIAPDFLAAKLCSKIIAYCFLNNDKPVKSLKSSLPLDGRGLG